MKRSFFNLVIVCVLYLPLSAFACSEHAHLPKQLNLFVVGTGIVGSDLLKQIENNDALYRERYGLHLHVVAIANSRTFVYRPSGIPINRWQELLADSQEKMSWEYFMESMRQFELGNVVFVDCSSNQEIADSYATLLESGISIVTPNKKANASSMATYKRLKELEGTHRAHFMYDANVGAGLPVLSTIKSLVRQGDEIVKIEAVLSGTLSYLFNSFGNDVLFSDLLRSAQQKGYTEPDPRDDLNGMDVARKLLIIAREIGKDCELSDVRVEKFLPESCFAAPSVDAFYAQLEQQDVALSELRDRAAADNKKLRFIATLENDALRISLQAVGPEHPFYNLSGNDNCVSITTRNYSNTPLVIQGPGAGAAVTAAKVLDGIVKLRVFQ